MSFSAKLSALLFPILPALALGHGQAPPQPGAAEVQTVGHLDPGNIAREIDDPSSGARWVLIRDSGHPGGPGQLVLIGTRDGIPARIQNGIQNGITVSVVREVPAPSSYLPVIRAGDPLVVEEHTPRADTQLEGIALGPARFGAALRLRLKLGGRIVRAIATGPGHATLAPDTEAWP